MELEGGATQIVEGARAVLLARHHFSKTHMIYRARNLFGSVCEWEIRAYETGSGKHVSILVNTASRKAALA